MKDTIEIACFYASSEQDTDLHKKFMQQLTPLIKTGVITYWHSGEISAGKNQEQEIEDHLQRADIVLLLISPDLISSEYYDNIINQTLERCKTGNVRFIPIYLRPANWQDKRFAALTPLPTNGQPVILFPNHDSAFLDIAKGIERVTEELKTVSIKKPSVVPLQKLINAILQKDKQSFLQFPLQKLYIPLLLVLVVMSSSLIVYRAARTTTQLGSPTSTPCGSIHDHLLCTYNGHKGQEVYDVSWSPSGNRIASSGYDKTIQVWDPTNGNTFFSYTNHSEAVSAVAWSPVGTSLASASYDGTVQVWDTTGSPLRTYRGHISSDQVLAVAWSPDGKRIASGSQDGTVQIWNVSTGQTIVTYKGHISPDGTRNKVNAVAWSPDGKRIASGGYDKTIQIWDAQTGRTSRVYKEQPGSVVAVAWSPNGNFIASSGGGMVKVWNPDTGVSSLTFAAQAWSITWSPRNKFIAIGTNDGTIQELDSLQGTPIFTYIGIASAVYTVAWSPEGTRIASGSADGMVRIWQVEHF
jgi:WD40 repeat protein